MLKGERWLALWALLPAHTACRQHMDHAVYDVWTDLGPGSAVYCLLSDPATCLKLFTVGAYLHGQPQQMHTSGRAFWGTRCFRGAVAIKGNPIEIHVESQASVANVMPALQGTGVKGNTAAFAVLCIHIC
jgi:hypothetical protein